MIPKTIHYCWFGGNPLPKLTKKCIKSWKKFCPDYEIVEWNESNYNISSAPLYVRQAYETRKWAFVTDYVRLWVVYNYGGIYLDSDVEIIKPIDELRKYDAFFGFDTGNRIATGLGFGATSKNQIIYNMMNDYNNILFLENGVQNLTPCPDINSHVFSEFGFNLNGEEQVLDNIILLSAKRMNPYRINGKIFQDADKVYSIHHDAASWFTPEMAEVKRKAELDAKNKAAHDRKEYIMHTPNRFIRKAIGDEFYEKIKMHLKK